MRENPLDETTPIANDTHDVGVVATTSLGVVAEAGPSFLSASSPFSEVATSFLRRKKNNSRISNTYRSYQNFLNHFPRFAQCDPPIGSITPIQVEEYSVYLELRFPKSGYKAFSLLQSLLIWAERMEIISKNPSLNIECPKKPKQKPRNPFTEEEYKRMMDACSTGCKSVEFENKLLVALGWVCGMSICDCIYLKWCDVNIGGSVITSDRRKTGITATIPFDPRSELASLLAQAKRVANSEYVLGGFHDVDKTIESKRIHAIRRFNTIMKRAGISNHSFHDFRGTMIRNLINSGVPSVVGIKITGHSTPDIYNLYAKIEEDDIRKAMQKIRGKVDRLPEIGEKIEFQPT